MATIGSGIAQYLLQAQQQRAADNLYSQMGASIMNAPVQVSRDASPWASFAANLAKGLMGGAMAGYGQAENEQYGRGLARYFSSGGTADLAALGLGEDDIASIQNDYSLFDMAKKDQAEALEAEIQRKVKETRLTSQAEKEGENDALRTFEAETGQKHPDDPALKLDKAIAEEEDKIRREINTYVPSTKQLANMQKAVPLVAAFKDQNTKSSDVGFVYNYIKSLDDGAVRGEEIDMANASNPLVLKYRNELQGALTGTSELGTELKNQMYRELRQAQKNVFEQTMKDVEPYLKIGEGRGAKRVKMLPFDPDAIKFDDLTPSNAGNDGRMQKAPQTDVQKRAAEILKKRSELKSVTGVVRG